MGDTEVRQDLCEDLKRRIEHMFKPLDDKARSKGVRPEVTLNLARLELDILEGWPYLSEELKTFVQHYFSIDCESNPPLIGLIYHLSTSQMLPERVKEANTG